jgi:hypothetical protein
VIHGIHAKSLFGRQGVNFEEFPLVVRQIQGQDALGLSETGEEEHSIKT